MLILRVPRRGRPGLALLALVVLLAGCRPGDRASITGECSFSGSPIDDGNIRFFPIEGAPGSGAAVKIRVGRYQIESGQGLFAGQYLVAISATRATGRQIAAAETIDGGPETISEVVQFIPEKYNALSTLKVTLTPGSNAHDFSLQP